MRSCHLASDCSAFSAHEIVSFGTIASGPELPPPRCAVKLLAQRAGSGAAATPDHIQAYLPDRDVCFLSRNMNSKHTAAHCATATGLCFADLLLDRLSGCSGCVACVHVSSGIFMQTKQKQRCATFV